MASRLRLTRAALCSGEVLWRWDQARGGEHLVAAHCEDRLGSSTGCKGGDGVSRFPPCSASPSFAAPKVETDRARAERHATRVAQTTPADPAGARRSPSPVLNAATGPDAQEQQGSSQPATEHPEDCTATPLLVWASGSASHARPEVPPGRRTLAMATELLRYRPTPDRHNDWFQRIEELIAAANDSAAFSYSLRPQPSQANDQEQDAPPPPPW
ncbi:hypothetical protein D1007_42146 [Hordeum vulgare]|nr:hypothetical protein D1007_42146 [Hordeum vulgare]